MLASLINDSMVLLQAVSVIVVAALLISRSRYFAEIMDGRATWKNRLVLILFFGIVSIYGSVIGINVFGAIINVRDLGPLVGGLACGPVVGLGAGLIGAAFRLSEGGFTAPACSILVILAGLFGGLVFRHRGRFPGVAFSTAFAILFELFHMALTLAISRPFDLAWDVVSQAFVPMILANGAGMLIFAFIISNVITHRETKRERDIYQLQLQIKQAELVVASDIQKSFLPKKIPSLKGFDIAATTIPAKEVGGDFYDFIEQDGNLQFAIADVSGKGVPAALFMALSRIIVRACSAPQRGVAERLGCANKMIVDDSGSATSGMFVTLFFAMLNRKDRSLVYANAGHNPPLLFRAASSSIEETEVTGVALGMMEDMEYEQRQLVLQSGDILFLYTDGIVEAMNGKEEFFGVDRLRFSLAAATEHSAQGILDSVLHDLRQFTVGAEQSDDITAMVFKAGDDPAAETNKTIFE
ncbi:MAG: phosphoserine phosphatase RsbU/P [Euryarchaeota archaeon]|nr:phosphoserine phosphatase RsbU/P [Euryarchaeota archaeon]